MEVARVPEFNIYLADRPGELAGVLEALAAAGVSVLALSVTEQSGTGLDRKGLVRLVAEPVEAVRRVCEGVTDTGAGPVAEGEVLMISLGENAARFREVAVRLADAKVNVRYVYPCPASNGSPARLILRVEDPERAEQVIRELALPGSTPNAGAA